MEKRERKTVTLNVTEARQQFSQLLNQVYRGEVRVVIEKNGIPIAALVTAQDVAEVERADANRAAMFAAMREISQAFVDVSQDELDRMVERAIAETRQQRRLETPSDSAAS